MTVRKVYIGSVGALLFDDEDLINDVDDDWDGEYQRALTTDSEISVAGIVTSITSITEDYTVLATDATILADATNGKITVTLPTASGLDGREYTAKKTDISRNIVVVDGYGTETIEGEETQELLWKGDSLKIFSDGTNWLII